MNSTTQTFTTSADSTTELNDAVRHAEALGFELDGIDASGAWVANDDAPVFVGGVTLDVTKVGRKYVHAVVDGESLPIRPTSGSVTKDAGSMTVRFVESK